jgi:hypothetical protein
MAKICPNCLRPVRSGANYCGYCGTILVPTPQDPAPTVKSSHKGKAKAMVSMPPRSKKSAKLGKSGRSWLKVPITLLILVILAALAIRYWPAILTFLTVALPMLKLS